MRGERGGDNDDDGRGKEEGGVFCLHCRERGGVPKFDRDGTVCCCHKQHRAASELCAPWDKFHVPQNLLSYVRKCTPHTLQTRRQQQTFCYNFGYAIQTHPLFGPFSLLKRPSFPSPSPVRSIHTHRARKCSTIDRATLRVNDTYYKGCTAATVPVSVWLDNCAYAVYKCRIGNRKAPDKGIKLRNDRRVTFSRGLNSPNWAKDSKGNRYKLWTYSLRVYSTRF